MSKVSMIVILCEDEAHEAFAVRFLRKTWKIDSRKIRVVPYPKKGEGSGREHVPDHLKEEVDAYRSRQASTALIVVTDADERSVASVKNSLEEKIGARREKDQIIYVIPKWHIETWLAWLDGDESVDETDKRHYKNKYPLKNRKDTKNIHHLVDRLAERCKGREALNFPPDSLIQACKEFDRIRNVLK